jgi:hypothetical protein
MSSRRLRPQTVAMVIVLASLAPSLARADHTQESTFQDDQYLLDSSAPRVNHTLALLSELGVARVRVNVDWSTVAPDPLSRTPPAGCDPALPADYPAANWTRYDRLVKYAAAYGIGVDFNVTAPGPLWAMQPHAPTSQAANHWSPSAADFLDFVVALGTRYSGTYTPSGAKEPLPRVSYWSIWNEPDQPGWLAPQWRKYRGKEVLNSPRLYRAYAEDAYLALAVTGHLSDTILIGELAPEGFTTPGAYTATTPMPFLRALYCVNGRYQRLSGNAAEALGCPATGTAKEFVAEYPVLFDATGFAHHPYYFHHPPSYTAPNQNFVPLSDLGRLEHGLDRAFAAYGVHRQLPIYITEYGYETNPPNPRQNVTPAQQAEYLNEADYIAWRDPRVRSVAQFLLYDSRPNTAYPRSNLKYWDTFQTGLLFANGTQKPAFSAYRLPIWIPSPRSAPRTRTFIWGQVRPGPHDVPQHVAIQWRPSRGRFKTLATIAFEQPEGYFTTRQRLPGAGSVRTAWRTPSGHVYYSRVVTVSQR